MFTLEESELLARMLRFAVWLFVCAVIAALSLLTLACPGVRARRARRPARPDVPYDLSEPATPVAHSPALFRSR